MGGLGCDNMTCVLVCLLHDQPYQTLVDKCVQTVKARDPTSEEEEKPATTAEDTEIQDLTWSPTKYKYVMNENDTTVNIIVVMRQ